MHYNLKAITNSIQVIKNKKKKKIYKHLKLEHIKIVFEAKYSARSNIHNVAKHVEIVCFKS